MNGEAKQRVHLIARMRLMYDDLSSMTPQRISLDF